MLVDEVVITVWITCNEDTLLYPWLCIPFLNLGQNCTLSSNCKSKNLSLKGQRISQYLNEEFLYYYRSNQNAPRIGTPGFRSSLNVLNNQQVCIMSLYNPFSAGYTYISLANSLEPDQMLSNSASDQVPSCLPFSQYFSWILRNLIKITIWSIRHFSRRQISQHAMG